MFVPQFILEIIGYRFWLHTCPNSTTSRLFLQKNNHRLWFISVIQSKWVCLKRGCPKISCSIIIIFPYFPRQNIAMRIAAISSPCLTIMQRWLSSPQCSPQVTFTNSSLDSFMLAMGHVLLSKAGAPKDELSKNQSWVNSSDDPSSFIYIYIYGGFHKWGVPTNGLFIMENPTKMDDLGVPLF